MLERKKYLQIVYSVFICGKLYYYFSFDFNKVIYIYDKKEFQKYLKY